MLEGPPVYAIVYLLGELEFAEKAFGAEAAERLAETLVARGHAPLIRDPEGRLYTLGQFRARPPAPKLGPQPEEILVGARGKTE